MFQQRAILGYIFIYVQVKHWCIISFIYLEIGEKFSATKRCSTITARKCLPKGQADPDNQRPDKWSSSVYVTYPTCACDNSDSCLFCMQVWGTAQWGGTTWTTTPVAATQSSPSTSRLSSRYEWRELTPSRVEFNNEWSNTSNSPCAFMAWTGAPLHS